MEPLRILISLAGPTYLASKFVLRRTLTSYRLLKLYGPSGFFLYYFGSMVTWRVEAQVLGRLDDDDAMEFKKSVQDECTMVSVAAAIVAQIAITALSLDGLSQTHWVAKGLLIFSLTDALMAVYYATTQQRAMGRLLRPKQVRAWTRGHNLVTAQEYWQRPLDSNAISTSISHRPPPRNNSNTLNSPIRMWAELLDGYGPLAPCDFKSFRKLIEEWDKPPVELYPCDPEDLDISQTKHLAASNYLQRKCFTPSAVSVITISAPQMLLSTALVTLLAGFGVYLGFTWTEKLNALAGPHDNRNIFIMYVVGLGVCAIVYSISSIVQEADTRSEAEILQDYVKEYVRPRKDTLEHDWGVAIAFDDEDKLCFTLPVELRNFSVEQATI